MTTSLLKVAALTALAAAANAQAFNWTLETPGTSPSARERCACGTDGSVYYLYGGQSSSGAVAGFDDLWAYDGITWTLVTTSGGSAGTRRGHFGAYDSTRGKMVVFGGNNTNGTALHENDTWEWDATLGWVNVVANGAAGSPDSRWLIGNGVDVPGLGVMFHGGAAWDSLGTSYISNETWWWNGSAWIEISSGTGPAVQNSMLVYRSQQNDLILHGGQSPNPAGGTVMNGETWRFDLNTFSWSQVITATTPRSNLASQSTQGLFGAMSYYNPNTGMVIVHGGNGGAGNSSTWQFDGTDWKDVSTNGLACRNGGMCWVNALGKAVYGPCNESNGTQNRTRSHGPSVTSAVVAYGSGCDGQAGTTLALASDGDPWTALTWSGTCTGMSAASPIKLGVWGFATTALPVTGILGAGPGCVLLNTADAIDVNFSATTSSTISLTIPPSPALAGIQLHAQAAEVDLSLLNLALSNGLSLTIGG